jgi:XTP/dITP diphosphohydrolase
VRDLGAHPDVSEIRESGTSFEENAKIKALAASRQLPALVIADDSGLEVEALGGAPGNLFGALRGDERDGQGQNR